MEEQNACSTPKHCSATAQLPSAALGLPRLFQADGSDGDTRKTA